MRNSSEHGVFIVGGAAPYMRVYSEPFFVWLEFSGLESRLCYYLPPGRVDAHDYLPPGQGASPYYLSPGQGGGGV